MRKLLLPLVLLLAAALPLGAQQPDSARVARLDALMDQYFYALAGESAAVQGAEMDFLIGSCTDSLLRQHIALRVYDHYLRSKIMGDEAVAIGVYDRWFATDSVQFKTELDRMNARIFADFNRASQIGMPAPELLLLDAEGLPVEPLRQSAGRYTLLYFYDTDCASCRIETERLQRFLDGSDRPLDVYAVYTGADAAAWARYRATHFPASVVQLWDPELASDFQRKYGVLQTPRMFLVGPDGTILGRGLDTAALQTLLDGIFAEKAYIYGSDDARALFAELFALEDGASGAVERIAGFVTSETLARGDTLSYRHLCGDLLYYLASAEGPALKEGEAWFIRTHILDGGMDPEIEALGKVRADLLGKTPVGERLPALSLHGTFYKSCFLSPRKARSGSWRLDRLRKDAYIVFYAPGCKRCEDLLARAETADVPVLMIDLDALFSAWPDEAAAALETFDLSALPFILHVSRDGRVAEKYLTSF